MLNTITKRHNDDIGFLVTQGELSGPARKIYNFLVFHSQKVGEAGKGVLPLQMDWIPPGLDVSRLYWMPIADVIKHCHVDKNNTSVRNAIEEIHNAKISASLFSGNASGRFWHNTISLLSSSHIINDNAGKTLIGWCFDPSVEKLMLDPKSFSPVSVYYQSFLARESAVALYEIASRCLTIDADEYRTKTLHWLEWRDILCSRSSLKSSEYRFFKRDHLKKACANINEKTDLVVTFADERRNSRCFDHITFIVKAKADFDNAFGARTVNKLVDLGVTRMSARNLVRDFGEEHCQSKIAALKLLPTKPSAPGAWLVAAIRKEQLPVEVGSSKAVVEQQAALSASNSELLESKFAEFFNAYPSQRSGARKEILAFWNEKFANASESETKAAVACLKKWVKSEAWAKDDGRYIPSAAKFLNEERYLTEPPLNRHFNTYDEDAKERMRKEARFNGMTIREIERIKKEEREKAEREAANATA